MNYKSKKIAQEKWCHLRLKKKGLFYGWILVAACFILYFLNGGVVVGLFFKPMLEEFGWDRATLSSVSSFGMILMAVAGPIVGGLVDKYGPRTIMLIGTITMGVSRLINGVALNLWQLYLSRIAMLIGPMRGISVMLNNWFLKKRGLVLGISSTGMSIGRIVLAPLTAYLILTYGWRTTYLIWAAVPFVVALPLTFFVVKNTPEELGYHQDGELISKEEKQSKTVSKVTEAVSDRMGISFQQAIKTSGFWFLACSHLICGLGCGFLMTHFVPFATDIGFSELEAAGALSLWSAVNIFGILSTGIISDRIGRKNALALTHFVRSIAFVVAVIGGGNWMIYLIAIFFGFGSFTTAPLASGLVADLFGGLSMGAIIGLSGTAHSIGSAIGSYMGGLTFDLTQSYYTYFLIMVPLSFTAALISFLIKKPKNKRKNVNKD
jgi:MFS family permease